MDYKQFVEKWKGKGIDYDGSFGNQCMDVYRQYVKEVLGCPQSPPVQGAKNVWDTYLSEYFDRIPNSPMGVPQQGDIVIWGMNPYGHIAICDHASTSTLTCFEQNWTELNGSGVTEIRLHGNYNNVLGWLRFKKPITNSETTMTSEEKVLLDFIKTNQITEGQLREGYSYVKDGTVAKLNEQIEDLKKLSQDLANRVSLLEADSKANNDLIISWQEKTSTANKQLENANKSNQELVTEKNRYKGLYENALKDQVNKYTGWQLIKMGISKLQIKK